MAEEQVQIDLAAVAKEVLRDRQPGEDLDVTLLRVCKDLYGTKGLEAFQTVRSAVGTYSNQSGVGLERAIQEIAGGSGVSNVITFTKTFGTQKVVTSLDELPPEMREKLQKILAFRREVSGTEGLASLLGLFLRFLFHSGKQSVDVRLGNPTSQPSATDKPAPTTKPQIAAQAQPAPQAGMVRCENCRLEYSKERVSCPGCGTERKRSFWTRLFGG